MPIDIAKEMDSDLAYSTKEVADLLEIKLNSARSLLNKAHNNGEVYKKNFRGKTYWARTV